VNRAYRHALTRELLICCSGQMEASGHELSKLQWRQIEVLWPRRAVAVGPPAEGNRRFINFMLWAVRSDMRREDLPERFGKYKSVQKRFILKTAVNAILVPSSPLL
jgi:transposase